MKKTLIGAGIAIALIFIYLVVITMFAQDALYKPAPQTEDTCSEDSCQVPYEVAGDTMINLGVSDSVAVTLTRHRWYGTIYVKAGDTGYVEELDWGFINIPMDINHHKLVLYHILVVTFSILIFIAFLIWDVKSNKRTERRDDEKWDNTGSYEDSGYSWEE